MQISLQGKNALVGGSSRGIGKAIAQQLAASGARVTLMARSEDQLKSIAASLTSNDGIPHDYLVVDFTDFDNYKNIITKYFEAHRVDILINNTQGPAPGNALEKNITEYQEAFDLLFKSVVYTTQLALKNMMQNKWGRIINVASISVKEPLGYLALSNTIRAAVVTWAKSLATEVAKDKITVNNILTGYFNTERISDLNKKKAEQMGISVDQVRKAMEEQVPVKRIGDPQEYGYLVAFLASDNASYITGTNIPIDGGLLKSL